MKKFSLKLIAAMMAVFMLVGVCVPAYAATNNTTEHEDYFAGPVSEALTAAALSELQEALLILEDAQQNIDKYTAEALEYAYSYAQENGYVEAAEEAFVELLFALPEIMEELEVVFEMLPADVQAAIEAVIEEVVDYLVENEILPSVPEDVPTVPENVPATEILFNPELLALLLKLASVMEEVEATVEAMGEAYDALLAQIEYQIDCVEAAIDAINAAVETQIQIANEYFAQKMAEIYGIALAVNATIEETIEKVRAFVIEVTNQILAVYNFAIELNVKIENAIAYVRALIAAIDNHIEKITAGDYTVNADSYYVAIGGAEYSYILAEALGLTEDEYLDMAWDEIDFAELAAADLITVSYNDSTVLSFVYSQLLNVALGLEAEELDWAALIGEENVAYIEAACAEIADAIQAAGIPECITVPAGSLGEFELSILEIAMTAIESALYEKIRYNIEYAETLLAINAINPDATVVALGAYNMYDIEIPDFTFEQIVCVNDLFMLETLPAALLGYVMTQVPADFEYANELIATLNYLAGLDYTTEDVTVSGTVSFEDINNLSSALPYAFAVRFANVVFVDIMGVDTYLDDVIAEYQATGDLEMVMSALMFFDLLAAPNEASCEYIVAQILAAIDVTCGHVYDDPCTDVDCNRCGEIRELVHTYTNNYVSNDDATHMADGTKTIVCDICGEKGDVTVTDAGSKKVNDHTFSGAWVSDNNNHWNVCECGEKANVAAHTDKDNNGKCDVCSHAVAVTPDNPPAGGGNGDNSNTGNNNQGTTTTPDDKKDEGMSTGAKVAVIASSSVVGLVGVFSLGWFGIAKKSWSELLDLFKK